MAASPKQTRPATYADLEALAENVVGEIVQGVLYTQARPATPHAATNLALGADLLNPFQRGKGGPGGWWILSEPEVHLHEDVLVPDLAGWRRERMPEMPKGPWLDLAPDWTCEILSPSTFTFDRAVKMPLYAREKVGHIWLIDPVAKTLEVYRLEKTHWLLLATHAGDAVVRAEPFDAIELDLKGLWLE